MTSTMLAGMFGIRLIVWMGKTIPTPPPPGVLDSLAEVEVTNDADHGDGFRLVFTLHKGVLDFHLLTSGLLDPFTRVVIGVVMGVVPEVLIDGVVTNHQLLPSDEPGKSTLTVMGRDLSALMHLEERSERFDNQPDFVIFNRLIAKYAQYGLVPIATPTADIPIVLQRTPWQVGTDLQFIQQMARRNGYVFYVSSITFGVNHAYFGPPVRVGAPQPALSQGMGPDSNLVSIHFRNEALAPVGAKGSFIEPITRTALPLPPLPSLRVPPLATSPAPPRRTTIVRDAAKKSPLQAGLAGLAAAMNSPDAVDGRGELDGVRYGAVLRARGLVGVRGVGHAYDGFYFVRSVTHQLTRGKYRQQFAISREGTGATLPVVRP